MPLLWLSLAFLAGIPLAAALSLQLVWLDGWVWLILAAVALSFPFLRLLVRRFIPPGFAQPPSRLAELKPPLPIFILLTALFLGAARYRYALPDLSDPGFIAIFNDRGTSFEVEGVLIEPPDERDQYANLRLDVEGIRLIGEAAFTPVRGSLLARLSAGGGWRYGDRLRLQGSLETPPEDEEFSYAAYLARQGVYSFMPYARGELVERDQGSVFWSWIYALKSRSLDMIYRLYPDPEASLLAGILLGVEGGIPSDVKKAFQDTGTAHVIVISGFNISIIGGLFAVIFLRLLGAPRRFLAAGLSTFFIFLYTLLVGADAAVVRAAIMGGLALFAVQLGRRQDGLNSLALAAALMALVSPLVLWDVSFQLSFMATLGLVLYAGPLTEAITRLVSRGVEPDVAQRLSRPLGEYLLFTLAALVTTLPVVAYHFKRISISALLANPVILPAQPPVMVLGGLAVMLGLVSQPLGQLAAYLAWPFVAYTIRAVEWFAGFPGGVIVLGNVALFWMAIYYAVLFLGTFASLRLPPLSSLVKPSLAFGTLAVLTVLVWQSALNAPDGRLHLTVLDVGGGEALLVTTPSGRQLLVNGGSSPTSLSDALGRRLPLLNRKLDYLVVAGTRPEQMSALPRVIERFPPDSVLWAASENESSTVRFLRGALDGPGLTLVAPQPGQALDLGQGANLRVLQVSESGAILLLEWGNFRAMLPVGLDEKTMKGMLQDPTKITPVTALLLADGGSASLNPPDWIDKLRPQVALLSVAADDREGRPSPETLAALQGYTLLRTDRNGWIELATDGEQLWVEVERR